ncbi:hypothetical protein C5167_028767 [Papaver somniferum]|uniref:GDSL esterase/lipase At5g03810-like n=1 Tax=Papaver somniferum TaxID=3469 RepID=UPI000E6F6E43|nr:GDSL esterase/lipase At5g03810-like [Papaver somniferum]RZC90934.1 hypothetical protein C5167_028767 [Papaver somniferum]
MGGPLRNLMVTSVFVVMIFTLANGDALVPALYIFGDSVVDVGNNNNRTTLIKANFYPYGRDFVTHKPTGRFCNGKLATDFTAENLGFTTYPPAYFSPEAKGSNILTGVNFASAASGLFDRTSRLYRAIALPEQLENYKDYQKTLVRMVGKSNATSIISGSIYLLSAGSSDFVQNYYINPLLNGPYTPDQYSDMLMNSFSTFVQNLYKLGARKIGVTSLPPLGCLPAAITLFGTLGSSQCVPRLNRDATAFNNKLNSTAIALQSRLPGLVMVVFDIYTPLYSFVTRPTDNGFFEARKACCGTGTLETAFLCNDRSVGTCMNATEYVFWDGFHPSEAANKMLADVLLLQGIPLISG